MIKFYTLLILLSVTSFAFSQDADFFKPNHIRRELKAVKIITNLKIDGELNEPEWELTKGASDFIQVEPMQGKPSQLVTIIKVLYNQKFLYVGVICKDPKGKKAAILKKLKKRTATYFNNIKQQSTYGRDNLS